MNNKSRNLSLTKASQQINAVTCLFGGRPVPASSVSSFYQLSAPLINGRMEPLSRHEGRVCLVVNMASADPTTRQELMQLNDLVTVFGPHGLSVLVFPCNQFGGLEPFYNDEIPLILQNVRPGAKFETKFQLFAKCEVNGSSASPVYEYLKVKLPLPTNDDSVLSHDSQHPATWKPVTRYDIQ
ncbi:hypothetical protein C0Q70_19252 [Pomacea canaliculata]|uniref:Glutathione peroxidase n=1 Tax=Pomacea canaliculata TaxID=400727 RepID=A0A2T7NIV9_POMCA|nr:hypothetical protein C0Q70_19252 [Pomacea canaliculata]